MTANIDSKAIYNNCYRKIQGICRPGVYMERRDQLTRSACKDYCNSKSPFCSTFLYGEGAPHMFSGRCELYDDVAKKADGNGGWSCYTKTDDCSPDATGDDYEYVPEE